MANHFVSINRGKEGMKYSDFTTGASTTAGDDIELRIADAASLTRHDVARACKAFIRWVENSDQTTFPPL